MVFAGDIFDLMVGSKEIFRQQYNLFFEMLATLGTQGVHLHYIEGNHDFHISGLFSKKPKVQVHLENVSLELDGKRFFVSHGDTANRADRKYLAYRRVMRSVPVHLLAQALPGRLVQKMGSRLSQASRSRGDRLEYCATGEAAERLRAIYRSYAVEKMQEGYDFVVLGHCHDRDEMRFSIGERTAHYMNVGYPPTHRSVVGWVSGSDRLIRLSYGV